MCGISGVAGMYDKVGLLPYITRMTQRLVHRGPNAGGVFAEDHIGLGHRRLSIIDLSEAANQPMHDASGRYVMVYNGELYNYRELKAKLGHYPFRSDSDSEVVLAAFTKWGADCLRYFNGMFAIAIWDRKEKTLFIARDRLGVKPLYYYYKDGLLIFASEIRALLASGIVPAKLDMNGISSFLMYQSACAPLTIVERVFQLQAGEYGIFRKGKLEKQFYWQIESPGETLNGTEPGIIRKEIRQLLTASVERRMVSDVPLGAFLSGGIDSSAIVGLMAECSDQPINTFSITFREPEFDESEYSSLIAERFRTNHTPIQLSGTDFLTSLPEALNAIDNPSGDGINSFLVSKATKGAGITVALSGVGGDELFCGYSSFRHWSHLNQMIWWKAPASFRCLSKKLIRIIGTNTRGIRLANILSSPSPGIENLYPSIRQVITAQQAKNLMTDFAGYSDPLQAVLEQKKEQLHLLPTLSQYSAAELLGYTSNVLLKDTDQMSMANALEVREPFFDFHLVEYVLRIPDKIKFPKYPKSLLVESLSPLLPDEIVHRPKKGFTLPWKTWLRHELKDWCSMNIQRLAERPEFNGKRVNEVASNFFDRPNNHYWMPLFQLAILEDWIERNFP